MPKMKKPVVVVVNTSGFTPGRGTHRRTVSSSQGGDYVIELPPGQPVALIGDDEVKAFDKYMNCSTIKQLQLTPQQSDSVLRDFAEKRQAEEIVKLRSEVSELQENLAKATVELADWRSAGQ